MWVSPQNSRDYITSYINTAIFELSDENSHHLLLEPFIHVSSVAVYFQRLLLHTGRGTIQDDSLSHNYPPSQQIYFVSKLFLVESPALFSPTNPLLSNKQHPLPPLRGLQKTALA